MPRRSRSVFGTGLVVLALTTGCTTAGSATAVPTRAPSPAPPFATGTGTPAPAPQPVPADLRLPNEGERASSPEFTDYITDNTVDQPWLLDPCRPTSYPTDARRTSFRTVSQTGPEAHNARQLGVYPSPEVAAEVLAGFRRALTACATGRTARGTPWTWEFRDEPGLGDDALLAASTIGSAESSPTGDRIAITRTGSAVFLAYGGGEFATAELDGGAIDLREVAREFLDSL